MKMNRNIRHTLPDDVALRVKKICLELARRPYVIKDNNQSILHVNGGIATILEPVSCNNGYLERGMAFLLGKRKIVATKIEVDERKFRGSSNHHKFRVFVIEGCIT